MARYQWLREAEKAFSEGGVRRLAPEELEHERDITERKGTWPVNSPTCGLSRNQSLLHREPPAQLTAGQCSLLQLPQQSSPHPTNASSEWVTAVHRGWLAFRGQQACN